MHHISLSAVQIPGHRHNQHRERHPHTMKQDGTKVWSLSARSSFDLLAKLLIRILAFFGTPCENSLGLSANFPIFNFGRHHSYVSLIHATRSTAKSTSFQLMISAVGLDQSFFQRNVGGKPLGTRGKLEENLQSQQPQRIGHHHHHHHHRCQLQSV